MEFSFDNGGQFVGVDVDDNVATITFTYDKSKDPVFNRFYSITE